jgi:phenylacetate-CoA ligase
MIQTGMQPQRGFVKAGKDLLFGIRYLSAYAYRPKEVRSLLYSLQGKRPIHLGGYASSLFAIAQLAEQEGITDVQFKGVVAWGDKLFAHYRSTIERVFSTRVFETYGCSEGLMIAAQKDNEFLYTMTPTVYLELLDDRGNDVPDGELGHVVVTSLTARAMPLIRYRLGDMAIRLPRSAYPDTRELAYPLLQQVIGRDTDLVRIRGGSIMVVHAFTRIFEDIPEIRQFHVVQRNLDSLEIEYIPGRGFHPAVLDAVAKKIQEGIEEPLSVTFRQVDEILDSPSGKPQIIQSLLDRGDIGP